MLNLLLAVVLVCHLSKTTPKSAEVSMRVDRMELNQYSWAEGCINHQVILWQWCHQGSCYKAVGFHFVPGDGSLNPWPVRGKWHFLHRNPWRPTSVTKYEAPELIETKTDYDPWKLANEQDRVRGRVTPRS